MRPPKLPVHATVDTEAYDAHTGRYLIVFKIGALRSGIAMLKKAGFSVAHPKKVGEPLISESDAPEADVIVLGQSGIALLSGEDDQFKRILVLASQRDGAILTVTREKAIKRASAQYNKSQHLDVLRGYHAAVSNLLESDAASWPPAAEVNAAPAGNWGLAATRVASSKFTGQGVGIAFADTGFDHNHPDFSGRNIQGFSAVPNTSAQDVFGHGTHCAGIGCGPSTPKGCPRYGVAGSSSIAIAKVTTDAGFGAQAWLIAGCEWAVTVGSRVICIAMQDAVSPGQTFDPAYETLAQSCGARGALMIAAAGNNSNRQIGVRRPVSSPADCPSIMGVAALDFEAGSLNVANFSNVGGLNPGGSNVDLCAPGVNILSSVPMPAEYRNASGTSQAAAFVAGIAALILEANPNLPPGQLWAALCQTAKPSPFPPAEAGAGLVQAPQ